ncbi:acetoin utilization protein AcuC [Paenibacillus sp. alder61]|uniref:Acetoin utilization protein AcuC n=1 Tax=Paenibacillus faecis TaxID=862114 RepID=A0A5D0CV84_9BACL|nr:MULTISPECIES: acetoin utilization protein AcuC [Paenibacillus]MCA1295095.1 acetoin utilization protein AcuC [Paenibacillus sp. alder61]TYA13084.1 acetoin utilization protein AcuC [Paenibacillus faecis]
MSGNALFVHHEQSLKYRFHDHHPFHPLRLQLTLDLLRACDALNSEEMLITRPATEEELLWIHQPAYIEAVKALSESPPDPAWMERAEQYGLMDEDTPYFPGMHEAAAYVVGGTITAVDAVLSGRADHALHLGGGLHHALSAKAAGFCVYNDAAVAIAYAKRRFGARVLYVDTDVHHGDGVQWSFYSDPDVCTYSIHETGKYLFPGTGFLQERGEHLGYGACMNIPLQPYTEDASWMECFETSITRLIGYFKPDLIVSLHGCDAHALDPLSHMHCSMAIYSKMPAILHRLAHAHCGGRWVAVGGGGYDMWRVVPRAWSLLWLEMSQHPLKEALDREDRPQTELPQSWAGKWQSQTPTPLPAFWLDDLTRWEAIPRRAEITAKNRENLAVALQDYPRVP